MDHSLRCYKGTDQFLMDQNLLYWQGRPNLGIKNHTPHCLLSPLTWIFGPEFVPSLADVWPCSAALVKDQNWPAQVHGRLAFPSPAPHGRRDWSEPLH